MAGKNKSPASAARGSQTAADALRRGWAAVENGCPEDAERIARDIIASTPRHAAALQLLGAALLAQRRAREAIPPLEEAAHAIANSTVETQLARALRDVGRTAEALTWLERATARQPPFAPALLDLGLLLSSLRRYTEAEAALRRGLEVAPEMAELSIELGGVFLSRADPANAKLAFARALTYAPGHPRALHGFGIALLYEGDHARAADRFRQVLARDPGHARARLDLAHCLLALGRHDEAATCLGEMVRADRKFEGKALKVLVSSRRGRFWLKRSAAAAFLGLAPIEARCMP